MSTILYGELYAASDHSISQEARKCYRALKFVGETPSVSVDGTYIESIEALVAVFLGASRPNWDGYGASPVSDAALAQALAFLELLPSTLSKPDISAHPDGEIAFEWFVAPRRQLTVSINDAGRLSYAAIFGGARIHGTESLLDAIPDAIILALRRLYEAE